MEMYVCCKMHSFTSKYSFFSSFQFPTTIPDEISTGKCTFSLSLMAESKQVFSVNFSELAENYKSIAI